MRALTVRVDNTDILSTHVYPNMALISTISKLLLWELHFRPVASGCRFSGVPVAEIKIMVQDISFIQL